jgi:hypothetical protein
MAFLLPVVNPFRFTAGKVSGRHRIPVIDRRSARVTLAGSLEEIAL